MSEWISCEDRLPDKGVMVMVARGKWVSTARIYNYWQLESGSFIPPSRVTHWMPLPDPPNP